MSVTVTLSTSLTTWRTSSWSERRNALCFWICSETVRVHCSSFPGLSSVGPAFLLGRTHRGRSAPSLHCSWVCHGREGCKRPPRPPAASRWVAWGAEGGCL